MKIGIVTGGGDCPGLNTVIRAVAKAADKRDWETIGISAAMPEDHRQRSITKCPSSTIVFGSVP